MRFVDANVFIYLKLGKKTTLLEGWINCLFFDVRA